MRTVTPFPLSDIVRSTSVIGILDLGASFVHKAPSYDHLVKASLARVTGFEPNIAECEKLRKIYGPPNQFFPYFIGDGCQATFYETNWFATGSLFKPNRVLLESFQNLHEVVTLVAQHPVQTKRLDDVDGLGEVDFIKLDVQGAELLVLQNGERVVNDASVVQVEVEFVELYEGQPLFADVDRYLRSRGFVFHTFHELASRCFKPLMYSNNPDQGIKQVLWADAVYVRDWANLASLGSDKLAKYATLVHELFGSYDLCLYLLERLDRRSASAYASQYAEKLIR